MVRNRFLLGSFAFGISFSISLLTTRDVNRALVTGLTTLPATVIAALMVDHRFQAQTSRRIAFLKNQIRTLQKQRAEAVEALQTLQASETASLSADAASPVEPPPRQLPPVAVAVSRKPLSWDLSAPIQPRSVIEVQPYELPTEVQILPPEEGESRLSRPSRLEMEKVLAEATATRQKIEANVRSLQTELNQLQSRVEQQKQSRDQLVKELSDLERQKRKLQTESSGLQKDVDQLKRRQQELDQSIAQAQAKKQEIETGAHPLHAAMQQMQAQVSSLQNELGRLENQVSDRQRQKVDLEQQLATLRNQLSQLQSQTHSSSPATNGSNGNGNSTPTRPAEKAKLVEKPKPPSKPAPEPVRPVVPAESLFSPSNPTTTAVAEPAKPDKAADLEEGWEEFLLSLPEYEFLVLKAIAEQSNPAGFIKKIAEDNLTMPELLIDSINERALDTVGDMVIEPGNGAGSAAIARDHTKIIKKLIKTYEYLAE
jgi:archaellum component FlaC